MSKLVVIIQCDTVQQRCCGYNRTHAFYSRESKFAGYPEDTHYNELHLRWLLRRCADG